VRIELHGAREDAGVERDTTDVGTGLGVVRVDGVEECFEGSGAEPFTGLVLAVLAGRGEGSDGEAGGEGEEVLHVMEITQEAYPSRTGRRNPGRQLTACKPTARE
jgi:hypothetical protein